MKIRLVSIGLIVSVALLALAACIAPQPATPTDVPLGAVSAPETFKSIQVKGLSALNGQVNMAQDVDIAGNLTIDGSITANSIITNNEAALTALSTTGNITADGALLVGGGYGQTGCTVSAAGVLQCNGAATTDGAMTAGSAVIGGGYGQTGCTVSAAGVLQCNGAATVDGATTSTGLLSANAGIAVDTSAFTVADTTGNTVVSGTLVVSNSATFAGMVIHSTASITPTDGGTITPTAEIMTLTPDGALGSDLGACTTGTSTTIYNAVNAAVVITDTGNGILAGNQTLGQYDALNLVCIGAKWVQQSAVSAN